MKKKRIGIIGAGPAGLSAGYRLAQNNYEVTIFESSDKIGGMARSLKLWGQIVDLGPHRFFSNDIRVNKIWFELAGKDFEIIRRQTRIYYKRKFYNYPLKNIKDLLSLGLFESIRCLGSYIIARLRNNPGDTFETWVIDKFGKRLFDIFFKTYSENLWGISTSEIDADWAAQRIKKLSLWEAIKISLIKNKKNKHETLVDQFAYPIKGSGMIFERMSDYIKEKGGNIKLNRPVTKILVQNGKAIGLEVEDNITYEFDYIISTMPLTTAVSNLEGILDEIKKKAQNLFYRNTIIVYLHIDQQNLFKDNWLYIHDRNVKFGRITNFRNWTNNSDESKNTVLALEYWCFDHDDLWLSSDEALINKAKEELYISGIIENAKILDGFVFRIPLSYPIYSSGYKKYLKPIEDYLKSIQNIEFIGRNGSFKYNNQDHSILMGILSAENVFENKKKYDLWKINTDYSSYQEV